MKYLSLFSGIGGFELGIGPNHECIGYSEIDKYATKVYQSHFPTHKNYGDITKINEKELPDFDFLCGGFPCQAFSIAGKRGGFADTRGTLFFDIARILKAKQPNLLLLENVKGLLSHDSGRTFATIIATLDELGYDLQWQVLNSKDYGVPQNRERVLIVGHLRGTPRPKVFPITGGDSKAIFGTITNSYHKGGHTGSYIAPKKIEQINQPVHSNDRVYDPKGISPTLNTMQGGNRQPFILQKSRGKNKGGAHAISPTVSANSFQDNNHLMEKGVVRRLTPMECERLQGFPDNWTNVVSDTQRYKTIGNAVTVNVIQAIVEKLSP